jgi:N-acetylglucosamine kinase-like BadF-type ATPase
MAEFVLAVDGGNSKTEVVVATTDGDVLARTRGPGIMSPLRDVDRWRDELIALVDEARRAASVAMDARALAAAYFLANVDLPAEHEVARRELTAATPAAVTVVHNDTLAVLRAGGSRRWGIAVVAGAGINAVGVDPGGHTEGFLALGEITGDYGGGEHLGLAALGAAVRARDGRGSATMLTSSVPAHFGLSTPEDVAIAVHVGQLTHQKLHVLAPVLMAAAAAGDAVARGILTLFADEVATMVAALIGRLRLGGEDVEIILGGGVLRAADAAVVNRIVAGVAAVAPRAVVSVLDVAPIFGALVEAFDQAGVDRAGLNRLRASMAR